MHTHKPQAHCGLCLLNSDLSTAASTPHKRHNDQEAPSRFLHIHAPHNVPDEILSICGGNLQPETGWLQTRGAADRRDGWGRWFVGCLKHKSKHLFKCNVRVRNCSSADPGPRFWGSLGYFILQQYLNQNNHLKEVNHEHKSMNSNKGIKSHTAAGQRNLKWEKVRKTTTRVWKKNCLAVSSVQ